jgi:hypothetical protein
MGVPWDDVARYAPIVTASVAVVAAIVAMGSIVVQRRLARKRAAIDFFLKTEMDDKMVEAYKKFHLALDDMKKQASLESFSQSEKYNDIRNYLDICELFAVGIHNKIFDHRICYHYWADTVCNACRDAKSVIEQIRLKPDGEKTYEQVTRLTALWSSKPRVWQRWRD